MPAMMDPILGDYARNVPDARWAPQMGPTCCTPGTILAALWPLLVSCSLRGTDRSHAGNIAVANFESSVLSCVLPCHDNAVGLLCSWQYLWASQGWSLVQQVKLCCSELNSDPRQPSGCKRVQIADHGPAAAPYPVWQQKMEMISLRLCSASAYAYCPFPTADRTVLAALVPVPSSWLSRGAVELRLLAAMSAPPESAPHMPGSLQGCRGAQPDCCVFCTS